MIQSRSKEGLLQIITLVQYYSIEDIICTNVIVQILLHSITLVQYYSIKEERSGRRNEGLQCWDRSCYYVNILLQYYDIEEDRSGRRQGRRAGDEEDTKGNRALDCAITFIL